MLVLSKKPQIWNFLKDFYCRFSKRSVVKSIKIYRFTVFVVEQHGLSDWPCHKRLEATKDKHFLTSPGYPNSYANNVEHDWCITARPGYYIRLVFVDFETEENNDNVTVCV